MSYQLRPAQPQTAQYTPDTPTGHGYSYSYIQPPPSTYQQYPPPIYTHPYRQQQLPSPPTYAPHDDCIRTQTWQASQSPLVSSPPPPLPPQELYAPLPPATKLLSSSEWAKSTTSLDGQTLGGGSVASLAPGLGPSVIFIDRDPRRLCGIKRNAVLAVLAIGVSLLVVGVVVGLGVGLGAGGSGREAEGEGTYTGSSTGPTKSRPDGASGYARV
ncbi:hypothetical protein F5Y15DRAFT_421776 [Xylariaceae sp. FL0016]|nr:hypothetical protein F5Y15DRAFT_421776 [Xylariaceae sp. FL0016]